MLNTLWILLSLSTQLKGDSHAEHVVGAVRKKLQADLQFCFSIQDYFLGKVWQLICLMKIEKQRKLSAQCEVSVSFIFLILDSMPSAPKSKKINIEF